MSDPKVRPQLTDRLLSGAWFFRAKCATRCFGVLWFRNEFAALWFSRLDFVGGGVACTLESAPHVPTGDGAVRAPAFAEGEEFFGTGLVFFAVGDGPAFLYAEVVDGKDVGAAEAEDQEHFDGPGADTADGDEALDEFFVREFFGFIECGDDAFDGFFG